MVRKEASTDEGSEEKRGRWRRLLALTLVACVLAAPFAKRAFRKLSNLYEDFSQKWSAMIQERAKANRVKHPPIELTEEMRDGVLYQALQHAQNVCFVGDSITKGPSSNGYVPWFEPLEFLVQGTVTNCGWGGATVQILLDDHIEAIIGAKADLYVVAIGTNDVMHRNPATCAMDARTYIERMTSLRAQILAANSIAEFVFIAPWYSGDGDGVGKQTYEEKLKLHGQYAEALGSWVAANGDGFIDPNPFIQNTFEKHSCSDYMADYVHPNASKGVELYCKAVLLYRNESGGK